MSPPAQCRRGAIWRARRCASALLRPLATVTTDAGGAVDAMHDSFLPLGGMVLIANMALGEVTFGGVGSGLYGMLAFAIVTMFVAGLMVGRTPEYLGKKTGGEGGQDDHALSPQLLAVDIGLYGA